MVNEALADVGSSCGKVMLDRCVLVSSAKVVDSHDCSLFPSLTTILELTSLSSRVFRTISLVGLTSWPSIL
jgi:hypothetical protein